MAENFERPNAAPDDPDDKTIRRGGPIPDFAQSHEEALKESQNRLADLKALVEQAEKEKKDQERNAEIEVKENVKRNVLERRGQMADDLVRVSFYDQKKLDADDEERARRQLDLWRREIAVLEGE